MTTLRWTLPRLLCIQLLFLASGAYMDFRKRKNGDSPVSNDRNKGPDAAPETTDTQFNQQRYSHGYETQTLSRQRERAKSNSSNNFMQANRNSNTYASRTGVLSAEDSWANEQESDGKSGKGASSESDSRDHSAKKGKRSGGRSGKKNGKGGKGKGGKGKGGWNYLGPTPTWTNNIPQVPTTPGPSEPTVSPTTMPTATPVENKLTPPAGTTTAPTRAPTPQPTPSPTASPTPSPTQAATPSPTAAPTPSPMEATPEPLQPQPTQPPLTQTPQTQLPSLAPSSPNDTPAPTPSPIVLPIDTSAPSSAPIVLPVDTPAPSSSPIIAPVDTPSPSSVPAATVRSIVETFALQGGDEFEDENSFQSQALSWVESNLNTESYSDVAIQEYYSLVTLYYSTFSIDNFWTQGSPAAWSDTTNWLNAEANKCNWYGVVCDDTERVVQLQLGNNTLTGFIPDEISLLNDTLVELWLNNSFFDAYQDEGTAWIGHLANLEVLDLNSCYVEYPGVPTTIAKLTNLKYLSLHFNALSGVLDGAIFADMNSLEYLDLSFNTFSTSLEEAEVPFNSTIPTEFAQLVNLNVLSLYDSFLYGDLDFIKPLVNLTTFEIYDNKDVVGTIPTEIGLMPDLAIFDSAGCGLSGPIPTEVGNLSYLEGFLVYDNALTGEVPTGFDGLVFLQVLSLELNEGLTGSIAEGVCTNVAFLASEGFDTFVSADCEITCNCCDCCGTGC